VCVCVRERERERERERGGERKESGVRQMVLEISFIFVGTGWCVLVYVNCR
jgi:hypothetical protein